MAETKKRYCVGCASNGYTMIDFDVLNRMPRKVPCQTCGGNPQQPWRSHWSREKGTYVFRHQDTGEEITILESKGQWPE